ncbi:MAG: hypothetical protein RLZZ543_837 [Bacteroidota bacterium]|jgi:hypothetical protein
MKTTYFSVVLLAFVTLTIAMPSCKKDKVRGCMNSVATNYAETATEDDGSCVFRRDKFIGDFTGSRNCSIDTLDSLITMSVVVNDIDFNKVNLVNFPEDGITVVANVKPENEYGLKIEAQTITHGTDVYSITGEGTYEGTDQLLILNIEKNRSGIIESCGIGVNKVQ